MNYRHLFHAGSFADLFKHISLIAIIQSFLKKDSPFCYLDTHAGAGRYDLSTLKNQKIKEYSTGVEKLFDLDHNHKIQSLLQNPLLQQYLSILKQVQYPHYYPGSPLIAKYCLRSQDKMILIEKHPKEYRYLTELFKTIEKDNPTSTIPNIAVHELDGYLGIKAFLPPKEKRGLILIDPPFENEEDWQQIVAAVELGLKRFSHGVYLIWYPIKDNKAVTDFKRSLKEVVKDKALLCGELSIYNEDVNLGLRGSGLMIINPPWQIENSINSFLPELWKLLSWQNQGGYRLSHY